MCGRAEHALVLDHSTGKREGTASGTATREPGEGGDRAAWSDQRGDGEDGRRGGDGGRALLDEEGEEQPDDRGAGEQGVDAVQDAAVAG
jgi:hypothetical protein